MFVHMVKPADPRTSACGLLWWREHPGREPARAAVDVTCQLCARSEPYTKGRFDVEPDRRTAAEIVAAWSAEERRS